jgi:hypothetical protein
MNSQDMRSLKQQVDDQRVGESARLDGNAVGGILGEVFVPEITTARATCANCGTTRTLGALLVYPHGMGTVIRCPSCDSLMLRVARTSTRLLLDATGTSLLVMAATAAPSAA